MCVCGKVFALAVSERLFFFLFFGISLLRVVVVVGVGELGGESELVFAGLIFVFIVLSFVMLLLLLFCVYS